MKFTYVVLVFGLMLPVGLFAQQTPAFEVASVKVVPPDAPHVYVPPLAGNRFTKSGTLRQLINYAYDLKVYQLSLASHPKDGLGDQDYFDISAKAEGDQALTEPRARQLLQTLLADRFQLKFHREQPEMPVYVLVVGKSGAKLRASAPGTESSAKGAVSLTTIKATYTSSPIDELVKVLSASADRPVLNQTGLTGVYDFQLEYARDPAAASSDTSVPSLFTAIQDQLGLRLDPKKAPIEVMIVDHAEKPSDN